MKLNNRPLDIGGHSWIVFGEHLPWHLQVAYGRYIARLMYAERKQVPGFSIWLRDLPLNVYDLGHMGFSRTVEAYESQARALGHTVETA